MWIVVQRYKLILQQGCDLASVKGCNIERVAQEIILHQSQPDVPVVEQGIFLRQDVLGQHECDLLVSVDNLVLVWCKYRLYYVYLPITHANVFMHVFTYWQAGLLMGLCMYIQSPLMCQCGCFGILQDFPMYIRVTMD
jgi:hypothetical protein